MLGGGLGPEGLELGFGGPDGLELTVGAGGREGLDTVGTGGSEGLDTVGTGGREGFEMLEEDFGLSASGRGLPAATLLVRINFCLECRRGQGSFLTW